MFPKWLSRLFTASKHTNPTLASIEQPVLDAAHAAAAGALAQAAAPVSDVLDNVANDVEQAVAPIAGGIAGRLGIDPATASAAEKVVFGLAVQTAKGAAIAELDKLLGITEPPPAPAA